MGSAFPAEPHDWFITTVERHGPIVLFVTRWDDGPTIVGHLSCPECPRADDTPHLETQCGLLTPRTND